MFLMIIRGDGPLSGYVLTGFFGGEYLTIVFVSFFVRTSFFFSFFNRSYFRSCRLSRGSRGY